MADNKQDRGEPDRLRINMGENYEIQYWTRTLGVSHAELERAVGAVGSSANAVREFLGK